MFLKVTAKTNDTMRIFALLYTFKISINEISYDFSVYFEQKYFYLPIIHRSTAKVTGDRHFIFGKNNVQSLCCRLC